MAFPVVVHPVMHSWSSPGFVSDGQVGRLSGLMVTFLRRMRWRPSRRRFGVIACRFGFSLTVLSTNVSRSNLFVKKKEEKVSRLQCQLSHQSPLGLMKLIDPVLCLRVLVGPHRRGGRIGA